MQCYRLRIKKGSPLSVNITAQSPVITRTENRILQFLEKKCHALSNQLVNDYWPAVVALAETLYEEKRIPAALVKEIVEEIIPPEVIAVTKNQLRFS
jgi:hypothetical protein